MNGTHDNAPGAGGAQVVSAGEAPPGKDAPAEDTPTEDRELAHRPVRSFVRRAGRLTRAQERALHELWPLYGSDSPDAPLDLDALFGRQAPRTLEIGFGNGDALLDHAAAHPEEDCLGVEVHEPGVGHCLLGIEARALCNVRLLRRDAVEVLQRQIAPGALRRVHIFFPDPWHKKRHHKRRLVQPPFVALLARALEPGGVVHLATDWPPYAEHVEAVFAAEPAFAMLADGEAQRARTRFEARGERLGHPIRDMHFGRRSG